MGYAVYFRYKFRLYYCNFVPGFLYNLLKVRKSVGGGGKMIIYKVFYKNYEFKRGELMGH